MEIQPVIKTMYSDDIIETIKRNADLTAIISQKIRLVKRGKDFWGVCPFHNDKNPSLKVDPQNGSWHCFGCGAGGSVFDFIMQAHGISFTEAKQMLAQSMGLQADSRALTPAQKQQQEERKQILQILTVTGTFYCKQLDSSAGAHANRYLRGRSLSQIAAQEFGLGYAPDSWDALSRHLSQKGIPEALAVKAGVLAQRDGRSGVYDRFRNRIMFPICDASGQIISFGGRTLGHDKAKYLNGPETSVFKKAHSLYNLHRARKYARDKGRIILVEGYFDVVTLAANGMGEVVAPMGTALTAQQVLLLKRQSTEIVLLFDGDDAGRKAANKALGLFLEASASPQVLWLPENEDPDSLVCQQGVEALNTKLSQTIPLIQAVLDAIIKKGNINIPENRSEMVRNCGDILKTIKDPVIKSGYMEYVAGRLNLSLSLLSNSLGLPAPPRLSPRTATAATEMLTNQRLFLESALSGSRSARRIAKTGILAEINHETLRPIAEALSQIIEAGENPDVDTLLLHFADQHLLCHQINTMAKRAPDENLEALEDQIAAWEKKNSKKRVLPLNKDLAEALARGDYEQATRLRQQIRMMTNDPYPRKD
ncbi:MAG: DNA primase [Desulfarculales bacterium]|nr:DNA primase [Desulfarculales bacterium]